ncbi:MAG TPA: tetratricopeptide repeat protein, partial [Vicinamibacteria bacterium]|nr:tetratricopeptide repeat protein [Vicinamibacteria bacterium]
MIARSARLSLALLALAAVGGGPVHTVQAQDAASALRSGDYDAAIVLLQRQAKKEPRAAEARRALVRTLAEVGRYDDAEEEAKAFQAANPRSPELLTSLGEIHSARGRNAEAESAFKKAIAGSASDALTAEVDLSALLLARGDTDAARRGFHRLIDAYNQSSSLSSEQLAAVARACWALGADDPQLFKDALKAFDEAIAADPDNVAARVGLVELFLEKYNRTDAASAAKDALDRNPSHPGALLAMARVLDADGAPGALETLDRSLKVNPAFEPARVFLAEVRLDQEDYAAAAREAERVLADNPVSLPALSALAAARHLQGDEAGYDAARKRALALNPRAAELYNRLAELSARNRLYREAADFAQQAVALDPRTWRGLGILGLNQLRLGAIEPGRQSLEASFKGDPYNVWIKNTLDLLDTFPKYKETRTEHFRILLHGKEAALLAPYTAELAEDAYAHLAARYGYRPDGPVRVEVYPDHADFSVRTVGLAGLAGLGACFGPVLAIDSPSAREVGQFNWGSTLWHEIAHTFTLGMTGNRVPRWFTEGLSVHEEHRARPGWGDDVTVDFVRALKAGELLPLADLNQGFIRPKGPEQVAISYFQASLVVEWIESQKGFPAVVALLKAYGDGRSTEQAFQAVLGTTLEDFDKAFFAQLEQRFAGPLAAIRPAGKTVALGPAARTTPADLEARAKADSGDFEAQLAAGAALFHAGQRAESVPYFERAQSLFPEFAGRESSHFYLAAIYKDQGKTSEAVRELQELTAISDGHYRGQLELARLLEDGGDLAGAAASLDAAIYISPFEAAVHEKRAALATRLGDHAGVVR